MAKKAKESAQHWAKKLEDSFAIMCKDTKSSTTVVKGNLLEAMQKLNELCGHDHHIIREEEQSETQSETSSIQE